MQRLLLHQRFAARSDQLRQVREWVRETAVTSGMSEERAGRVVIGVNEACMNIISHAYDDEGGDIVLDMMQDGSLLVIQLTDFARTVDCSKIKSRDLDDIRPGGLGVHFIHEIMDQVEYQPGRQGSGNIVVMKVSIQE